MVEIILRKMKEGDIQNIYKYIHLDYVKKYYPNRELEQWEAHRRWYSFVINSPTYLFYVVENLSRDFLGTVKFELVSKTCGIISIYLRQDVRGRGYSRLILSQCIEEIKFEKPHIEKICAYILEENTISQRVFTKNLFKFVGKDEYLGEEHLMYERKI